MIKQLEAKHTVFSSIDEMLSSENLSNLVHQTVNNVQETPLQEHGGLAGARISYIDTNVGRYVLKRMSKSTTIAIFSSIFNSISNSNFNSKSDSYGSANESNNTNGYSY